MLIGLTGLAGSGKDTFAKVLVKEFGYRQYAFADRLKEFLLMLNPIVVITGTELEYPHRVKALTLSEAVKQYGWDYVKRNSPEVRRMLITLGTDIVRSVYSEYWADYLFEKIYEDFFVGLYENGSNRDRLQEIKAIISDLRFPNEVDQTEHFGGVIIKVTKPGLEPCVNHESEKPENLKYDYEIINDATLEEFKEKVRTLCYNIKV